MNIKYEHFERITITGNEPEFEAAREYCKNEGFKILRQGPVPVMDGKQQATDGDGKPKFDRSKFLIYAEKKIK